MTAHYRTVRLTAKGWAWVEANYPRPTRPAQTSPGWACPECRRPTPVRHGRVSLHVNSDGVWCIRGYDQPPIRQE